MENKLKIGVVGAGYWGKNLVRNFEALGVLDAICDSRKETLDGLSKQYPHCRTMDSYRAILDDSSIEAVCIASPEEMH